MVKSGDEGAGGENGVGGGEWMGAVDNTNINDILVPYRQKRQWHSAMVKAIGEGVLGYLEDSSVEGGKK